MSDERDETLALFQSFDCDWGCGCGRRHCTDKPCVTHQRDAATDAERERCLALIRRYIRFDDCQRHRHTWHDFDDLLTAIAIRSGTDPRPAAAGADQRPGGP